MASHLFLDKFWLVSVANKKFPEFMLVFFGGGGGYGVESFVI